MRGQLWTDEKIEELKKLYEQGYSCNMIALKMECGFTRNAIIGKIHRLGFGLRGAGKHQPIETAARNGIGERCGSATIEEGGMIRRKKYVQWTNRQICRLRECYPKMSNEELAKEFAPRSIPSIQGAAYKMGLRRPSRRDWKTICARHKPVILRWSGTL